MPDIKIRDVVKGTVKAIDKSAVAAERMKDAYIRTKDKAEHGVFAAESSPEEYAADRTLPFLPISPKRCKSMASPNTGV